MATLLSGVNDVLKKVDVLDTSGELTSLTDSARQSYVDAAVKALNEAIDHLYGLTEMPKPTLLGEEWVTLVEGDRSYPLDDTLIVLRREYHLVDETNNHIIRILGEDGYRQIILGDVQQDDTGLPSCAAVSPVDGELYMDRTPTSSETGRRYKYRFEKDFELTDATDEFPFTNAVLRAIVPAAAELWKLDKQNQFAEGVFNASMARAARFLLRLPTSDSWMPRLNGRNITDPLAE